MTQPERKANFDRTRREAGTAVAAWLLAFAWTVSVSWWLGQESPPPMLFGLPRWVVIGVACPWLACFAFNCWYTLVFQREPAP